VSEHARESWMDRMFASVWFDRVNAVFLVTAVTLGAVAALIRQTGLFICTMLWIWTVCALGTGYGMGRHNERLRHDRR
jgi:hypothetical protein